MHSKLFDPREKRVRFMDYFTGQDGEGGDDNGGGDNGGSGGDIPPEVQKLIASAVDEATKGLKSTNSALKNEKTEIKQKLDAFSSMLEGLGGEEGVKALQKMKENLEKDELGKLLTEGKHDEWFDRRVENLRTNHTNQLKQFEDNLAAADERANKAEAAFRDLVLETEIRKAAAEAGLVDTAHDDALFRAKATFSFDEEHGLVIKEADGGIKYGKDGKTPMSIAEWLDAQKETARHWWPASKGGGAGGSNFQGQGRVDVSKMSMKEYKEWRKTQDK